MPLILTEEQRRLVRSTAGAGPIEVIDPGSSATYVLMRTDAFARLAAQADPHVAADGMDEQLLLETL
jgi:hypothetical protein